MVTKNLISNPAVDISLLIVFVFIAQSYADSYGVMDAYFLLQMPIEENLWTIISSTFAHANMSHLSSNLLALLILGLPIAIKASKTRFYLFFVAVGSIAGVSQILFFYAAGQLGFLNTTVSGVLGASGAIFGLMGYLITSNRITDFSSRFLQAPRKIRYLIYLFVAVWITLATATPQAALVGHFTGLIMGMGAGRQNLLRVTDEQSKKDT